MRTTLVYNADKELCKWASERLFGDKYPPFGDDCSAIGVALDGRIIASVVYSNYFPNVNMDMSIASIDKRWATRFNLNAFFAFPFIQLGLKRVTTLCSANEGKIIEFNKTLGFIPEGYHKDLWFSGGDCISFRMLKNECRWLRNG